MASSDFFDFSDAEKVKSPGRQTSHASDLRASEPSSSCSSSATIHYDKDVSPVVNSENRVEPTLLHVDPWQDLDFVFSDAEDQYCSNLAELQTFAPRSKSEPIFQTSGRKRKQPSSERIDQPLAGVKRRKSKTKNHGSKTKDDEARDHHFHPANPLSTTVSNFSIRPVRPPEEWLSPEIDAELDLDDETGQLWRTPFAGIRKNPLMGADNRTLGGARGSVGLSDRRSTIPPGDLRVKTAATTATTLTADVSSGTDQPKSKGNSTNKQKTLAKIQQFMTDIQNIQLKQSTIRELCPDCRFPLSTSIENDRQICVRPNCNYQRKSRENTKATLAYGEEFDIIPDYLQKQKFHISNRVHAQLHFTMWQYGAPYVANEIILYIFCKIWVDFDYNKIQQIQWHDVRYTLLQLGWTKYYAHTTQIWCRIRNGQMKSVLPQLQNQILTMFGMIAKEYIKFCGEKRNLNYPATMARIFIQHKRRDLLQYLWLNDDKKADDIENDFWKSIGLGCAPSHTQVNGAGDS